MCVEDRIQPHDFFADCLLTKVRRGVNEHAAPFIFHQDGRTRAPVVWISRRAHAAGASDRGHTHGCPTTQHGENCLHLFAIVGPAPGGLPLGALAMAFVTSIQAIRNSNRTFCSKTCSRSERLPLVFSWIRLSESMVCRALTMSTFA